MASKKYRIEQQIELISVGRNEHRWTVAIHVDENDKEGEPLCTASGTTKNKNKAASNVASFTKWALKAYELFTGYDDDDEDDDD